MQQPDFLQTDKHLNWSWGRGNDVWAMFAAAASGDVDTLRELVAREPSLLRCESHYRTPLHFAVRENQIDAARFLLEQGVEPTYTQGSGWHDSTMQLTRDRGDREMLDLLETHQYSQWKICAAGDEIGQAMCERNVEKTDALLAEHGFEVADARGNQPLHWAVMTRQVDLIRSLVASGADINHQRPDGARPLDLTNGDYFYRGWRDLHPDAPEDHWAIMDVLLELGAFYDLTTACRRQDINRVKQILHDDPESGKRDADYVTWYSGYPLRSATKSGNREIVELLLAHGADPNRPEHGIAPLGGSLYEAAAHEHYELLQLLLDHGANPNQDVESSGCVLSATRDEQVKQMLREHGAMIDPYRCCYDGVVEDFEKHCEADPHVANDSGLFAMAAQLGHRAVVEVFLRYQPDLWQRMPARLGETPEITRWMIDCGMQVNQVDWLGVHQLHYGVSLSELDEWNALGVDLNIIDGEHQTTPLGGAARRGDLELADALLDKGVNPMTAGHRWAEPWQWAERRNHSELEKRLRR